jgi:hypothetical protein
MPAASDGPASALDMDRCRLRADFGFGVGFTDAAADAAGEMAGAGVEVRAVVEVIALAAGVGLVVGVDLVAGVVA